MYLVFADKDIVRNTEIVEDFLSYDIEESKPDYTITPFKSINVDILLGVYNEDEGSVEEVIRKVAKEFETDEAYLYIVRADKFSQEYIGS